MFLDNTFDFKILLSVKDTLLAFIILKHNSLAQSISVPNIIITLIIISYNSCSIGMVKSGLDVVFQKKKTEDTASFIYQLASDKKTAFRVIDVRHKLLLYT